MGSDTQPTATQSVFRKMLANVHTGQWPVGSAIPSERTLITDFGVSRIAIREALSMLRGLGVLDVGHGRRTQVRKVDSETFAQFLPLLLASGGQRSFDQIFEVRLAVESATAYLAAKRRSDEQVSLLNELVDRFRDEHLSGSENGSATDLEFHMAIAKMTGNPLFPVLLEALGSFVAFAQRESCKDDPARSQRAVAAHEAIADAIAAGDAERSRVEMEAHLRYSATRKLNSGELQPGDSKTLERNLKGGHPDMLLRN